MSIELKKQWFESICYKSDEVIAELDFLTKSGVLPSEILISSSSLSPTKFYYFFYKKLNRFETEFDEKFPDYAKMRKEIENKQK